MGKAEIRNARIKDVFLGWEDHGMFTVIIHLDYGGSEQGFGGYELDSYDKEKKKRVSTKAGLAFIMNVMKVVGVHNWEDLKGKYIRVDSNLRDVRGIGHITQDKWFYPEDMDWLT